MPSIISGPLALSGPVVGTSMYWIAYGDGSLWIGADSNLYQVDPDTGVSVRVKANFFASGVGAGMWADAQWDDASGKLVGSGYGSTSTYGRWTQRRTTTGVQDAKLWNGDNATSYGDVLALELLSAFDVAGTEVADVVAHEGLARVRRYTGRDGAVPSNVVVSAQLSNNVSGIAWTGQELLAYTYDSGSAHVYSLDPDTLDVVADDWLPFGSVEGVAYDPLRGGVWVLGGGQVYLTSGFNAAPNAPILIVPADGAKVDRNATQRFDWDFSDPDAGDSQSAYNFRYRATGAATWTETGWQSLTQTYRDVAGGTFADGTEYEWQVATKDAQGAEGPFSTSSFFTAATAPAAPTITSPTNGGTFLQSQTVSWSTPDQDAYQLRVMDGTTVVSDTGTMTSSTARFATVNLPTNGVTRTIQLRVRDGGLWSQWAEVTGTVSWLAPPAPTFTLLEDPTRGRLSVVISNPAPSGEEPATSYNDVLIDDADGKGYDYRHGSRMIAPNGTYIYRLPRSGVDYSDKVRVVSYAENGVYSTSD